MVKEYEQASASGRFLLHEQVDVKDEKGTWMNAEVLEVAAGKVKVRFSGYSHKFDTWIEENSPDVLHQWRPNQEFQVNNRLDVLDTHGQWREARVIDLNTGQIHITYRGYAAKYNEWLHKTSNRIQVIGGKSGAHGSGKLDPSNNYRYSKQEPKSEGEKFLLETDREKRFAQLLQLNSMKIVPMNGDGNCLFRSVSHQLYGDESFHMLIREASMRYISLEREYFCQFMIGGAEKFDEYLAQMSRSGAWGDDIEIQAMSEIYNKPFNIFAYSSLPIRTFHEDHGQGRAIRLAYHGQCHYNSVVDVQGQGRMIDSSPGEFEQHVLEQATRELFRAGLARHRQRFEENLHMDIEEALRSSLAAFEGEDVMLRQAIEVSKKDNEDLELNLSEQQMIEQALHLSQNEDELVKHALEISKKDAVPEAVIYVMNSGFTFEQAMTAWHMCGDNPNSMIEYICAELF